MLDGVGGGLFEALLPLVLADIMAGTGHYSLARGVVGTVQGIGGSSSQVVAGFIVTMAAAFLTLAKVATAGLLLIVIAMPETTLKRQPILTVERPREADAADCFGWARLVPWAFDGVYCVLAGGEEQHCQPEKSSRAHMISGISQIAAGRES